MAIIIIIDDNLKSITSKFYTCNFWIKNVNIFHIKKKRKRTVNILVKGLVFGFLMGS